MRINITPPITDLVRGKKYSLVMLIKWNQPTIEIVCLLRCK